MRGRAARAVALAAVLAGPSCAHLERGGPVVPPAPTAALVPRIRIGVVVGQAGAELGGGAALRISRPDGTALARIPAGTTAHVSRTAAGLQVRLDSVALAEVEAAVVSPEDTGTVRVGGRDYRGQLDLVVTAAGLVVANRVTIEEYLAGVVTAEMGRRAPEELDALRAQAVVSRTVALRAIGRSPERGYDLLGTVADQAYLGVPGELAQGVEAVADTRGIVLTHGGVLIDAFFHSPCGGRTAEPTDIFAGAGGRPYLRSVSDQAPDGRDYCAISPRYRWREEWSGQRLLATLRETLSGGARLTGVRGVDVLRRGPTGRVMAVTVSHPGGVIPVEGANAVRQLLRPPGGGLLRSSDFTLQAGQVGAGLDRLVAEGRGAGHGVGMCQWGAIGRARAGAGWAAILAAYFPGADLGRLY
jgi:stage II sporulation protein D